ncbi:FliH/SctL family protein [Oscillospiraceae bacterium MB08-C2-2]|nr:FliH/SctL family protein [Oscillospiraceae bacterium MB08-C2-2]
MSNILKAPFPRAIDRSEKRWEAYQAGGVLKNGAAVLDFEAAGKLPPVLSYDPERDVFRLSGEGASKRRSHGELLEKSNLSPMEEIRFMREELRRERAEMEEALGRERESVEQQGEALLRKARAQAEEIIKDAEIRKKSLFESAQSEGYMAGFSEGYREAEADFDSHAVPQLESIQTILGRLVRYEQEMQEKYRNDMVDTVFAVASKVIKTQLQTDRKAIVGLLEDVLEKNNREEWIKITFSKDMAPVEAVSNGELTRMLTELGNNIKVEVIPHEENLVLVETPKGYTEVTPQVQLEILKDAVKA